MPHSISSLRSRTAKGPRLLGTMVQCDSAEIVEIAGRAGYDFVVLDAEHGALDVGAVANLIRAADASATAAVVRVPDHGSSFIQRVLDAGAAGILAPRVRSREQAQAIVRSARFAPHGERGACATSRSAGYWTTDWRSFARTEPAQPLVWALVEDAAGVESAAQIAAVEGLDGLVFGAFDFAQDAGLDGDVAHPRVLAAFNAVLRVAQAQGLPLVAVTGSEPGGMPGAVARGARIVLDGFDAQILMQAYRRRMQALLEGLQP